MDAMNMSDEEFNEVCEQMLNGTYKDPEEQEAETSTEDVEDASTEELDTETTEVEESASVDDVEDSGYEQTEDEESEASNHNSDEDESEVEEEEDSSSESEKEDESEAQTLENQTVTVRAKGKDYTFTVEEMIKQFPAAFGKAVDYTQKTQQLKPWRQTIDALQEAELSHQDVSFMIDALKGDKGALTELLKRTGVDALDLGQESENPYVQKIYGRSSKELSVDDVVSELRESEGFARTQEVLVNGWDNESVKLLMDNPETIRGLHEDIQNGTFDMLQTEATKLKVFNGNLGNDLDYYKEAAKRHVLKQREEAKLEEEAKKAAEQAEQKAKMEKLKAEAQKRKNAENAAQKRKAASVAKGVNSTTVDVFNDADDDEQFAAFMKKYGNM